MDEKLFKIQNLQNDAWHKDLGKQLFDQMLPVEAECCPSWEPVPWKRRKEGTFRPVAVGEKWGDLWGSGWFKLTVTIPEAWRGKPVTLKLGLGGEILLFKEDDPLPLCGLTCVSIYQPNYVKELYHVTDSAVPGKYVFWAEVGVNALFGENTPAEVRLGEIKVMQYGIFRPEVQQLCYDVGFLSDLSRNQPGARSAKLMKVLHRAKHVYKNDPENAAAARQVLKEAYACHSSGWEETSYSVGHAHIDVGWLWPVRESIRKAARTFSSQIEYLKKYPEYVFGASQPQLYSFVKEHYPELYAEIKKYVAEGRWELQGGMWVEADCNLISGESMVRQFLHGKNFFKDEFGIEVKNLWIPDVFGYSAAMPQILRKSGCDFFLTQKISWSETNRFPYHSFHWEGVDGSTVLTHFPPENTYNAGNSAYGLLKAQENYNENGLGTGFMTLYGIGDGGGGPKEEHIENGLRARDLAGVPKVKFAKAAEFFDQLQTFASQLPAWRGELYLELHRGTLTTHGAVKRGNRKAEEKLQETEFLCSALSGKEYPKAMLDKLWKLLLLNQFHDILPGSSIAKVYQVTEPEHQQILDECNALQNTFDRSEKNAVTFANTLSYRYTSPLTLPADWANCEITDAAGNALPGQTEADGTVLVNAPLGLLSFTTFRRGGKKLNQTESTDSLVLENELIKYTFDQNAKLVGVFDKTLGRELSGPEPGNRLSLYADTPYSWEAWDVNYDYPEQWLEDAQAISHTLRESGPVRQTIGFELTIGKSRISQRISLGVNSKRLDFDTTYECSENRKMLRVVFPTPADAAESISDIQYAFIKRPTHTNTSWDFAKFEVTAQKYADLTDLNGGFALLNDCKYGYHLTRNTIDLNLVRTPNYPDGHGCTDQGTHHFVYSYLPHNEEFVKSGVIAEAAMLNRPPHRFAGEINAEFPCRLADECGVAMTVLKQAEKSDSTVIRLVETRGLNSSCRLLLPAGAKAVECDLLEWRETAPVPTEKSAVTLTLKPFEIKTLRIK